MSSKINLFHQSWVNTVFDGRNKSYGAYELRQSNPKTTLRALLFGSLFFIGVIAYPVIKNVLGNMGGEEKEEIREVKLQKVDQPKKKEEKKEEILEEKKPIEEKKTQTVTDIQKFVPPVVVEKKEVKEELATIEELKNKNVGTETMKGNENGDLVMDNTATEQKSQEGEVIDYNQIFTSVEVEAGPPGGIEAFRTKIARYLGDEFSDLEDPLVGEVTLRFAIMEDGSFDRFSVVKENPKGMKLAEKSINFVKRQPKWTPAEMNGRKVKSWRTLPLKFQLGG